MADVTEKPLGAHAVEPVDTLEKPVVVDTKVLLGDEAFNQAMLKEPPIP
jgi:hypothetical protein